MSERARHPNFPTDRSIARAARDFAGSTVTQAQEFMAERWGAYVKRESSTGLRGEAGEIYEMLWEGFTAALRSAGRELENR